MEVFYEALARHHTVACLFQHQLWASALPHVFQPHLCSALRPLFTTLHGLLRAPALIGLFSTCLPFFNLSVLLQPVCPSSTACPSSTCLSFFNLSVLLQPVRPSSTCPSFFNLSVLLQPVCPSSTCLSFFNLSVYHLSVCLSVICLSITFLSI